MANKHRWVAANQQTAPQNFGEFKIRPLIYGPKLPLKFALRKDSKGILAVKIPANILHSSGLTSESTIQSEAYFKELDQLSTQFESLTLNVLGFPFS